MELYDYKIYDYLLFNCLEDMIVKSQGCQGLQ